MESKKIAKIKKLVSSLFSHKIAYGISGSNRRKKWELFLKEMCPDETTLVLDIGFSENEYSSTDNFIEKNYPYPENLTALGVDPPKEFTARYPKVRAVQYDGSFFPFKDKEFDVCWSNAVIEHVGNRDKQLLFLNEVKRVTKRAFITTPNRFFPIEVHTRTPLLHYLPKEIFDTYLTLVGEEWATGDYMHLLSLKNLTSLLQEAEIKQYKLCKNRLAGFVLDFVVMFESD
jgi:SAM-dependent methyltransferase